MALQGSITFDNGITLSSGYLTVVEVSMYYGIGDNTAKISVMVHKDAAAFSAGNPEVIEYEHNVDDGDFTIYFSETVLKVLNKTSLTQAYVWLKTLPQYSSLTEV